MLPPVIDEGDVFPFKFWFDESIRDGMYYRNELYYRLHTVDVGQRAGLYLYACKLSQENAVVVTSTDKACSLWLNLRSSGATAFPNHSPLPPLTDFFSKKIYPPQP